MSGLEFDGDRDASRFAENAFEFLATMHDRLGIEARADGDWDISLYTYDGKGGYTPTGKAIVDDETGQITYLAEHT